MLLEQCNVGAVLYQLVDHFTSIAKGRVWVLFRPEFFRPSFHYCLSSIAKLQRTLTLKLLPSTVQMKFHYFDQTQQLCNIQHLSYRLSNTLLLSKFFFFLMCCHCECVSELVIDVFAININFSTSERGSKRKNVYCYMKFSWTYIFLLEKGLIIITILLHLHAHFFKFSLFTCVLFSKNDRETYNKCWHSVTSL